MNIATALNQKYINYTIVMLTSLCENNPVHIDAYLLHSELTDENIKYMQNCLSQYNIALIPITVDKELFDDRFPRNSKWSLEAYYRLFLLDYLPASVERILYLDVDLIINKSLEEFYTVDFGTDEIIACADCHGLIGWEGRKEKQRQMFAPMIEMEYQYFNSGVMLLNISQMRGKYNFNFYLQAIMEWNFEMYAPDQDILNYVHWQHIGYIDPYTYNLVACQAYNEHIPYADVKENAFIIHFTGPKPWNTTDVHFDIEKIWWDYAALTPCYPILTSDFVRDMFENSVLGKKFQSLYDQLNLTTQQLAQLNEVNKLYQELVGMLQPST